MKFETIMLNGLFAACITLCVLVMGAMLRITPASVQLSGATHSASIAASHCATTDAGCARVAG
jgi:hypothetical protein